MKRDTKKTTWVLLIAFLLLGVWFFWFQTPTAENSAESRPAAGLADNSAGTSQENNKPAAVPLAKDAPGLPKGPYLHVFDKAAGANRFLLAKGYDKKYVPDADAHGGMDLWVRDESGMERMISPSVVQAKFSPDGTKVAFATPEYNIHIEDLHGGKLAEVQGAYSPSWKPDGSAVIFSKVPNGQDVHELGGTAHLASLDLATGNMNFLTDGHHNDSLPEFHPSSDWVIFVSGSRTGLASFWKVPAKGGEPAQITNVGLEEVNDRFVPVPYDKTMWSKDQRWFVYDFKSGEQEETWGLEFEADGTMKRAAKLADGINPRWQGDGNTFVCEKHANGIAQMVFGNLPVNTN
jgi:hypothetical protein